MSKNVLLGFALVSAQVVHVHDHSTNECPLSTESLYVTNTLKLYIHLHLISFQSVDPVIGLPVMSSKGSFSVECLS